MMIALYVLLGSASASMMMLAFPSLFLRVLARRRVPWAEILYPKVALRSYPGWLRRFFPKSTVATTFGSVVLIDERLWGPLPHDRRAQILRHELVHVRQARTWGPLFLVAYLLLYVRYGYQAHPWEIAAREAAGES